MLKSPDGKFKLLNASELDGRVDRWLKAAGATRAACGTLIFTWNDFRIECDPQSVIGWLSTVTLPDNLKAGSAFIDPDARGAATLQTAGAGRLSATLQIDPAVIRRKRAETDVSVGELMRKPVSIEAALNAHQAETITGAIAVTFDADEIGRTREKTRVSTVRIAWPNDRIDTQTVTEKVTRTPF